MKEIYNKLTNIVSCNQIYLNELMKNHTTFKIGGPADYFIKVKNIEELIGVLQIAKQYRLPITVIGNGSNVLVLDEGIRGICIKLDFQELLVENENQVIVGAGVLLPKLSNFACENELTGIEFACGIPGTLGGAIYMNSGAYGMQMSDVITSTTYLDENLEVKTINTVEQDFSYRKSIFQNKNWIVLSCKLELKKGNKEEIKQIMAENNACRKAKQPLNKYSAGSTFKRGKDFVTAELIDKCGLKGYSIGDAQVSTMHAGFIINNGEATARDILKLVEYVKHKIKKEFNKEIELEVKVLE